MPQDRGETPEAALRALATIESNLARLSSKPDYADLVGDVRQIVREIRAELDQD